MAEVTLSDTNFNAEVLEADRSTLHGKEVQWGHAFEEVTNDHVPGLGENTAHVIGGAGLLVLALRNDRLDVSLGQLRRTVKHPQFTTDTTRL